MFKLYLFLLHDVERYVLVREGSVALEFGDWKEISETPGFENLATFKDAEAIDLTKEDRLPTPAEIGCRDEVTPHYRKVVGLPMLRIHELMARNRLEVPDYTVPCLTAVIDRFANTPAIEKFYETIAWLTHPKDIMILHPDGVPAELSFAFACYKRDLYEEAKMFQRQSRERPWLNGGIIYRGPFRRTDPFSVHLGELDPNEHQWTTHT